MLSPNLEAQSDRGEDLELPDGPLPAPTRKPVRAAYNSRYRVLTWRHSLRSPVTDREIYDLDAALEDAKVNIQRGASSVHIMVYRTRL